MAANERILLLDVDGVLITPPDWYGLVIRRQAPQPASEFFEGPFLATSKGEKDLLDELPWLIAALGLTCSPQEFLTEWHEYENSPNLELWDEVRRLRSEGWRVFLAINQERHRLHHLLNRAGLAEIVDGEFASCSIGHRKPSDEYYAEVSRRLDISPAQIWFFDDSEENIVAAQAAGWNAHVYRDVADFRSKLESLS
jgi:putative hydrolase of the HAD superfamily